MRSMLLSLILAGSLMAGNDRSSDDERDFYLWQLYQQEQQEAHERQRERECAKCIQEQLANPMTSLNGALLICQDLCD